MKKSAQLASLTKAHGRGDGRIVVGRLNTEAADPAAEARAILQLMGGW